MPSSVKDDLALAKDPLIGRLIGGRYRIASALGTGAMATIYTARDVEEQRIVAVKIIKPELLIKNKTATARFHREATAASKLHHPGIVRVTDWGFDGKTPYIAMELVQGEDLFELLDRRGTLTEAESLRVLLELCAALHVAHEQGIVHRDLKPENIMVSGVDDDSDKPVRIKVLDFGIAKLVGRQPGEKWADETAPQALTKVGSAVGTPSHMAPEQARGFAVDGRTDIYACGVLLYEMVTGHLPFEGDNPLSVAVRQVRDPPPPPSNHKPNMLPELEALILRMLEKKPEARFQTVEDLAAALSTVLRTIDPEHVAAGRPIPPASEAEPITVERAAPTDLDDSESEQLTAQRDVPVSLRGMVDKRTRKDEGEGDSSAKDPTTTTTTTTTTERGETAPEPNDGDTLSDSHVISDPTTMDLDTLSGNRLRGDSRRKLHETAETSTMATPSSTGFTTTRVVHVDKPAARRKPFPVRSAVPRRLAKGRRGLARDTDGDDTTHVAEGDDPTHIDEGDDAGTHEGRTVERLAGRTGAHDIDDEDSEGSIATVVADPKNLQRDAAKLVLQARAIADAAQNERRTRSLANAVTQQSAFDNVGPRHGSSSVPPPMPKIDVIMAKTSPASGPPPRGDRQAHAGLPQPPVNSPSGFPPEVANAKLSAPGAANELEDLLRQMPRQREPIVGSVVVLTFLGVAIAALLYLLVGAATF